MKLRAFTGNRVIVALLLSLSAASGAQVWQGYPVADAFVTSDVPDRNTGDWTWLAVTYWPSMPFPWYEEAFVRFDLSAIPPGSLVSSAELRLFAYDRIDTAYVGCSRVSGDWAENGVTWNNRPGFDTAGQVWFRLDTHPAQVLLHPAGIVQRWVNGAPNYGFCLHPPDSSREYTLALRSREHYDSTEVPSLIVTWQGTDETECARQDWLSPIAVEPNPSSGDQIFLRSPLLCRQAVRLDVHDILGKRILTRLASPNSTGQVRLNLAGLPSGIYVVELVGGPASARRQFVLSR
jgi:hypothetical protein